MKNYQIKGFIKYYLAKVDGMSKLSSLIQTKEAYKENIVKRCIVPFDKIGEEIIEKEFCIPVYDLISGSDFLEMVKTKCIINYDGVLDCILVNGYKTNLGLVSKNGFIDGEFLVDEATFKTLCNENEVLVNWANK